MQATARVMNLRLLSRRCQGSMVSGVTAEDASEEEEERRAREESS